MSGASNPLPPLSPKDIERFWSKVEMRDPAECWPWKAGRFDTGYGACKVAGQNWGAHRIALFLTSGVDPAPLLSCHTCDNPPCCNGRHLFAGTNADNLGDMAAKGRSVAGRKMPPECFHRGDDHHARLHPERLARGDRSGSRLHPERLARGNRHGSRTHPERVPRGERNGSAKLTEADVSEVKRLRASGLRNAKIGSIFGVSESTISLINRRKIWWWVE